MDKKVLSDRQKYLLQLIVGEYIKTGKPISSHYLCNEYDINFSSATVRNEISILEKSGYLMQPHISSGRIPTNEGYRYYVNFLMNIQKVTIKEEKRLKKEFNTKINELDKIMQETSKMIAHITDFAGFSVSVDDFESKISHIQLSLLGRNKDKILFVVVTEDNIVKHKIIELEESLENESDIIELTNIFNEKFVGKKFFDFTDKVIDIVLEEKKKLDTMMKFTKIIMEQLENFDNKKLYYIEESPNFLTNIGLSGNIYEDLKKQHFLSEILNKITYSKTSDEIKKDINIYIGDMKDNLFKNCSIITSTYKMGKRPIGIFGIIGPKRMNYEKMIGLIEFISNILKKIRK